MNKFFYSRVAFVFAFVCLSLLAATNAQSQDTFGNYNYRKKLTLKTTTYISGSSDLSNFPVLLEITDTDLIQTGNASDKLKSSVANDIAFTDATVTQSSATEYNFQIESYDSIAGRLKIWVKIPSLSKSTNNTIYFYFGDANPSHIANIATGTWSSDYKAVFHFNESSYSAGADAIKDGTSQGKNATLSGDANNLTTGFIGKAYSFNGSNQKISTTSSLATTSVFTLSAWVKPTALSVDQKIMTNQYPYASGVDDNLKGKGYKMGIFSTNKAETELSGQTDRNSGGGFTLNTGEWYYIQSVYQSSEVRTYVNGAYYRSGWGGGPTTEGTTFNIGVGEGGNVYWFNGIIDEVRVSDVAKSADWIATEYNNQKYPGNTGAGTGLSGGDPFISAVDAIEVMNTAPTAPTDVNGSTNIIAENSANTSTVGITASSSLGDGAGPIVYSLTNNAGGRFTINSSTGVVTVNDGTLLDYESSTLHSITVQASDGNMISSQSFDINVSNVIESIPVDINSTLNTVAENASNGSTVGITAFAENEDGITEVYSLTDNAGGRFTINSSTGVVTVLNGTLLDYEANPSYLIKIRATAGPLKTEQTFTITLTDVGESPIVGYKNYLYRKKLTLNTTNYISGSSNLTNFPVLLEIVDTDLRTGTGSDKLKSSTANDIAFTDATETQNTATELSYQLESYDASTGTIRAWVRIPTLNKSTNNTLYLYFGSTNPAAHPADSTTWTSDYKAVFHFNESTYSGSAGAIKNGKGSNHGTAAGAANNLTTSGKIGNAYSFNGTDQKISTSSTVSITGTFTLSVWVKQLDKTTSSGDQKIMTNQVSSSNTKGVKLGIYNQNGAWSNRPELECNGSYPTSNRSIGGGTTLNNTDWYYIQAVYDGTNIYNYVNGVAERSTGGVAPTDGGVLHIGTGEGGNTWWFNGLLDEVRVSTNAKSADWIATEYNNQRYPSNIGTGLDGGSPFISTYESIEAVNTPPASITDINTSANSVQESPTNGTAVGITASATDPEGLAITYSLTDNANGRFAINSTTGIVTVADGTLLNTKGMSYPITIQASDGNYTSTLTETITVSAVTYTWTGDDSTDPTDPRKNTNWNNTTTLEDDELPLNDGTVNLVIPGGLTHYPSLEEDLSGFGVTIESGASISLNGFKLSSKYNITNSGQILYNNDNSSTIAFNGSLATQNYTGTSATSIGKLEVNNTASGTVTLSGAAINVYNLVTVTQGTLNANNFLTLKASATTNANVGPISSGAAISGNVNVESYFTGGSAAHRGTRVISSPINDNLSSPKTYQQLKNYMVITGPTLDAGGFDWGGVSNTAGTTLTKYYEPGTLTSQFLSVNNITDALPQGTGAFLFYRGNRDNYSVATAGTSNKVNAPYAIPESQTITYTGPINQGDITVNLTYTNHASETNYNGYNLIGNPYPAVIDWESVTKNNVQNELKLIKPTGGFVSYLNGVSTPETPNIRYIQPGQGFYTRSLAGGGSVTFTESSKAVNNTPERLLYTGRDASLTFNSNAISLPKTLASIKLLRMKLSNTLNTEEAVVRFEPSYSAKAGLDDATFFGGTTVSLSTLSSDNIKLAINGMPSLSQVGQQIPISVNATSSGNVTLSFTDLSALSGFEATLVDNYLNVQTDVRANPSYSFLIDKSIATTYGDTRFKLLITPPTVLSVNLSYFSARKSNSGSLISWASDSEVNAQKFEVERSINGSDFTTIGSIAAKGNSSSRTEYSYFDNSPFAGINYYRLKQMDSDNTASYSKAASLDFSLVNEGYFKVYPNPAIDLIKLDNINQPAGIILSILNLDGKMLKSTKIAKGEAPEMKVSDLISGVYVLKVEDQNTHTVLGKVKFIKQ